MKIGDLVVVSDPEGYVAEVRNKIKDGRVGEIVNLDDREDYAMVRFPATTRRKEFRHRFRTRFLEPAVQVDPPSITPPRRPTP